MFEANYMHNNPTSWCNYEKYIKHLYENPKVHRPLFLNDEMKSAAKFWSNLSKHILVLHNNSGLHNYTNYRLPKLFEVQQ